MMLIVLPLTTYAIEAEDLFTISGIEQDENFIPLRISITVFNDNFFVLGDNLQINYRFNEQEISQICSHEISFANENSIQKRIYCPVPVQLVSGLYQAEILILRDSQKLISQNISFFYNSPNSLATHHFRLVPEGTEVTINIQNIDNQELFELYHSIPNTVIPRLTYENRDNLILSENDFIIIQENPIVSWQVTSREERIQYIILDKELSEEEKVQFASYTIPKESGLNLILLFSILILLLIIFVPFFTFKKK